MRTNLVLQSANVNIFELALDSVELAAIASELAEAPGSPTGVYTSDQGLTAESTMDDEIRQTHEVQASHAVRVAVRKAIDSCQSDLERTYGQLERPRRLGYLRYKAGHHFLAHRDVLIMPDGHLNPTSRRKVSIVLFLNNQSTAEGCGGYAGGSLVFQAIDDPAFGHLGFGVDQRAGLMVAFPSSLLHEVTPVLSGTRLSVVGWYE